MKKLLAALTAILSVTALCCGCRDKGIKELPEVSEEEVFEFREVAAADANEVMLAATVDKNDAPFEVHSVELPDFEDKKSICSSFMETEFHGLPDPESFPSQEAYETFIEQICMRNAQLGNAVLCGENVYFTVNYAKDWHYDIGSHDVTLYELNTGSGDMREILSFSDPDSAVRCDGICAYGGDLYISMAYHPEGCGIVSTDIGASFENIKTVSYLLRFDLEKNTSERLFEVEDDIDLPQLYIDGGKLIYSGVYEESDSNFIYSYSSESGEWETVGEYKNGKRHWLRNGRVISAKGIKDQLKITCEDRYTATIIPTDLSNQYKEDEASFPGYWIYSFYEKLVDANESDLLFIAERYSNSMRKYQLRRLNVETNTMFVTDLEGFGTDIKPVGDGLVISSEYAIYYMKPEIGLLFPIKTGLTEYISVNAGEDTVVFLTKNGDKTEINWVRTEELP